MTDTRPSGSPSSALSVAAPRERSMNVAVLWVSYTGYLGAELTELHRRGHRIKLACEKLTPHASFATERPDWMDVEDFYSGTERIRQLAQELEEFGPDLLLVCGWQVRAYRRIALRWRGRCTRVLFMDNNWTESPKQWLGRLTARRYLMPAFDAVLLPGERQAQFARRLGFEERQIAQGGNTANVVAFSLPPGSKRGRDFVFCGRLLNDKGVDVLAEAYGRYRELTGESAQKLVVCGSGPLASLLRGIPGIELRGFVDEAGLADVFQSAAFLVLPSRFEPWGLVIHEASVAGCGIIASQACGASVHLVRTGHNGRIVQAGSSTELLSALLWAHEVSDEELLGIREHSRALSQQYSPSMWADNLLDLGERHSPTSTATKSSPRDLAGREYGTRDVLVVHNLLWSKYKGSVFTELAKLANAQVNYRFVHIAQSERRRTKLTADDLAYHQYPYLLLNEGNYEDVATMRLAWQLVRTVMARRPALVVLPGYYKLEYWVALMVAKVLRIKTAAFADSTAFDHPQTRWKNRLKWPFIRVCDGFFTYGQRSRSYLEHLGVDPARVHTRCQAAALEPGYSADQFRDVSLRRLTVSNGPEFLYVGRLAPEKGLDCLLEAFALYRKAGDRARLVICGDGPMRQKVEERSVELGLVAHVEFAGLLGPVELAQRYRSATCLVLPSHSEPWGLVVNEALHHGCPVVVSDRCGCVPELVLEGVTGFSFSDGDAVELAGRLASIVSLVEDSAEQVAQRCLAVVKPFNASNAAAQMDIGCRKILGI